MTVSTDDIPRLANGAERMVYQVLREQLQPNDRVIPGQRVTDHLKDHEIDFVVAIEGAGIVCLEVKGGDVWHDGDSWWQRRGGREHKIDPVRQVRDACYALRDFVESDARWSQGRLRWDHVVVLPHAEVSEDFALPECPRWKVIDRNDLPALVDKLRDVLIRQEIDRAPATRCHSAEVLTPSRCFLRVSRGHIAPRLQHQIPELDLVVAHRAVRPPPAPIAVLQAYRPGVHLFGGVAPGECLSGLHRPPLEQCECLALRAGTQQPILLPQQVIGHHHRRPGYAPSGR